MCDPDDLGMMLGKSMMFSSIYMNDDDDDDDIDDIDPLSNKHKHHNY